MSGKMDRDAAAKRVNIREHGSEPAWRARPADDFVALTDCRDRKEDE